MLENATPLPVKAAGGVRTYDEAVEMIKLVKRIGTSGAKAIANGENTTLDTNFTIKINMKKGLFALVLSFFLLLAIRKTDLLESSISPERFPVFPL
jgi:hypothetical protein